MENPTVESPVAKVQVEAVKTLAKGFDKKDYSGLEHRATLQTITRSIATGATSDVKTEGIRQLGDYATRVSSKTGSEYLQLPQVQEETVEAITGLSCDDKDIAVKDVGLDQVTRRLDMKDYRGGAIHGQAVDSVRRIASSVTVKDGDEATTSLVKKAVDVLGAYSTRSSSKTGSEYLQAANVQEAAKGAISFITTTMGVEKFTDLKP